MDSYSFSCLAKGKGRLNCCLDKEGKFMKIVKQLTILALAFLSVLGTIGDRVFADDSPQIPFQITANIPENQVDTSKNASYLDLLVNPGTNQDVTFNVSNSSNTEQHFILDASDATTSNGLSIDYGKATNKLIKSPRLSEMVSPEDASKKLTLAPNSTQQVSLKLNYPATQFDGVVLGGVTLYKDPDYEKTKKSESQVSIQNIYKYALAIQLRSNLTSQVKPEFNFIDVKQTVDNSMPVLKTTIQNPNPAYISQLSTHVSVKNSKGELLEESSSNMGQVAPISEFDIVTSLKKGSLKPGEYDIEGSAKSERTGDEWHWNKKLVITDDNYKDTDKQDVTKAPFVMPWGTIIIILLLLIILILFFLLWKRRKDDEDDEEKND